MSCFGALERSPIKTVCDERRCFFFLPPRFPVQNSYLLSGLLEVSIMKFAFAVIVIGGCDQHNMN